MSRLTEVSEQRVYHAERAELMLRDIRQANPVLLAQVHATLALFYQGEARDLAGQLDADS